MVGKIKKINKWEGKATSIRHLRVSVKVLNVYYLRENKDKKENNSSFILAWSVVTSWSGISRFMAAACLESQM